MLILATIIFVFTFILAGFMLTALVMDITKTSDTALKDYYKRNK